MSSSMSIPAGGISTHSRGFFEKVKAGVKGAVKEEVDFYIGCDNSTKLFNTGYKAASVGATIHAARKTETLVEEIVCVGKYATTKVIRGGAKAAAKTAAKGIGIGLIPDAYHVAHGFYKDFTGSGY
ncbi:hypothetical protein CLTEP_18240 [Clostridium tepidiprofundi DSM 19306]|uniref:Uncharacterized protein n=1 Tax=Clostridium tepidiprofundi DSM 19306 TaxID=1121338 RepID=A0A151B2T6_9CLOT|nr:hypothetical protein [Clostridium tepidiprofundi]KYH34249.1 hypothetical protein CLTEP_18240 [Clostridium tepidiprofundi DSM 19306]